MRLVGRLLAAALLAAPALVLATDAPHEAGLFCSNCHMGHNAPGVALTNEIGNANLCQSCHVNHPGKFGFPWSDADQAVPGEKGTSHRWDAEATNLGATPPVGTPMGDKERLSGGLLQCSTCHDQHDADQLLGSPADAAHLGTQHTSYPAGTAQNPTTGGTGRTLTLVSPVGTAATAKGYLLEVVAGGSPTTATFKLSNDNGTSWFGCSAPTSYSYVAFASNACQAGPSVPLNDGANVTVAFGGDPGTFVAGDRWSFYVSYPYLRVSNKDGAMCTTCHQDRHMYWQDVEGGVANEVAGGRLTTVSLGTTVFHHPVGQALRAPPPGGILDPDGSAQDSGDSNATNDLVFGAAGEVTCLTCHRPHNTDSNSLSVDPR